MLSGRRMDREAPHRVLNVLDRAAGRRVDTFLSLRFPSWSRSTFAKWIKEGVVQSDSRTLKPSSVLRLGEVLRIWAPGIAPAEGPPPPPAILYEDDWLLAVDKPAGMLVHPVGQRFAWALIGLVREMRPGVRIDLSHRLDRETSGIVVLTKHEDANRAMKDAFQARRVQKTYQALVRGVVPWEAQSVDASLGHKAGSVVQLRRGADPAGESALTEVSVLRRLERHTLVECRPHTGRTHQIRVHLEIAGFPILGDKLYGQPDEVFLSLLDGGVTPALRETIGFPRHALHAHAPAVPHPHSGQMLKVRAPLPADMQAVADGAEPCWPEVDEAAEIEASDEE